MILNGYYLNYIFLGHFCSVAMELERFGLRSASFPFDWLITDFKGVIEAINYFFNISLFEQSKQRLYVYRNRKYGFEFVHDFSKYKTLLEQFVSFQKKYERRINRFLKISEPTLFVRYIRDTTKLEWIEKNIMLVLKTIKKHNSQNDLLFVANDGITSNIIRIYNVVPDKNDSVCRDFFSANVSLNVFFKSCKFLDRNCNIKRYEVKNSFVKKFTRDLRKNFVLFYKKIFCTVYVHNKCYEERKNETPIML